MNKRIIISIIAILIVTIMVGLVWYFNRNSNYSNEVNSQNINEINDNNNQTTNNKNSGIINLLLKDTWQPKYAYDAITGESISLINVYGSGIRETPNGGFIFNEDGTFTAYIGVTDDLEKEEGNYKISIEENKINLQYKNNETDSIKSLEYIENYNGEHALKGVIDNEYDHFIVYFCQSNQDVNVLKMKTSNEKIDFGNIVFCIYDNRINNVGVDEKFYTYDENGKYLGMAYSYYNAVLKGREEFIKETNLWDYRSDGYEAVPFALNLYRDKIDIKNIELISDFSYVSGIIINDINNTYNVSVSVTEVGRVDLDNNGLDEYLAYLKDDNNNFTITILINSDLNKYAFIQVYKNAQLSFYKENSLDEWFKTSTLNELIIADINQNGIMELYYKIRGFGEECSSGEYYFAIEYNNNEIKREESKVDLYFDY